MRPEAFPLVLMGSAVAGGIGLAGYKMFGPGEADRTGGNLSLFAPKPQKGTLGSLASREADAAKAFADRGITVLNQ